jgi:hypothetical protein
MTAIEGNKNNLNNQRGITSIERLYEDEAVTCFRQWRKNGGWLSSIPIYAFCPTHNVISPNTRRLLEDINVTYIEEYQAITSTFTSGFLNVPLVGMLLESRVPEDVLIKIDLDMNLIQPLPPSLVDDPIVACGQYDDYCTKLQRSTTTGGINPFDTGFIISRRDSGFYQFYFELTRQLLTGELVDPAWLTVKAQTGEYYLEEYVMDKMYLEKLWPIRPIQKYQIGEWYTPVAEFTDSELQRVYFWHEHLIPDAKYNRIREKVEYFNRMTRASK